MRSTPEQTDPLLLKIARMKRLCAEAYAALPERFRRPPLDFELCPEGPPPLRVIGSPTPEERQPLEALASKPEPLCQVLEFRTRSTSPKPRKPN